MPLLRFLGNLLLALLLITLCILVMGTAYGVINTQARELRSLDEGAQGGQWVWIDEQPIYYRAWGPEDGRPVVLVHGYQVEGSETWSSLAEMLARMGLRVVAIDLKGFGHSVRDAARVYSVRQQANLLGAVLNQMGLQGATVVTHGWGAAVALQLVGEQPQFARQMVLIAPEIERQRPLVWHKALQAPYLGRALIWAEQSGGPVWRLLHTQGLADPTSLPKDYWQRIEQPTRIIGTVNALLAMATSPRDDDLPEALASIKVPVTILVGDKGKRCPYEQAEQLAGALPQAQVKVIAKSGDFAHIEQRAAVGQVIVQVALYGER